MKPATLPPVVRLPGDTSLREVRRIAKEQDMRPTIDIRAIEWVLRPRLRSVK